MPSIVNYLRLSRTLCGLLFCLFLSSDVLSTSEVVSHINIPHSSESSLMMSCTPTPNCIGGLVFDDLNCNGVEDATEVGVAGIQVEIYDNQNTLVNSATSDLNGDWQICGLVDGEDYRVEFSIPTNLDSWAKNTHAGIDNGTDVQFVTAPDCAKFSVVNPAEYCENDNPNLIINCFVRGAYDDPLISNSLAIALLPYSDAEDRDGNVNGTTAPAVNPFSEGLIYTPARPTYDTLVTFGEVGTVWGMAKAQSTNMLFSSSYIKGGSSLGPGESTGLIYATTNFEGNPSTSAYVDLNVIFGANTAGANPHPTATSSFLFPSDTTTNIFIGKVGLGDMDISKDEDSLYIINMQDRMLYQIPTAGALNSTSINRFAIPTNGLPTVTDAAGTPGTCAPADVRPFATGVDANGAVYVGAVCSCESISAGIDAQPNDASYQMTAYVWRFDGVNFTLVLNESLRFNRDFFNTDYNTFDTHIEGDGAILHRDWEPWSNLTVAATSRMDQNEPMFSDIEFDTAGNMVLGFRDRSGDIQSISGGFTSSGDIYKACASGTGTWQFESNGSCDNVTTAGANNNEGPNGGEFYFQDRQGDFIPNSGNGGVLIVPGKGQVVSSATDAVYYDSNGNTIFAPDAGGIQIYDNTTGEIVGAYNLYEADATNSFIKAAGIGDIESSCSPAPIELGNYVWCDSVQNGIQDAFETGVNNMVVQLYSAAGDLVGQDTTVNGNYYFNELNVDTTGIAVDPSGQASPITQWSGLSYSTKYFILFGNAQYDMITGAFTIDNEAYNGITTVDANANSNDNIDSDVDPNLLSTALGSMPLGFPVVCITTDSIGCGDHRYDMGINCPVYDWGDLPDTGAGTSAGNYNTTDTDMGPSHTLFPGLRIGALVDSEVDGQASTDALGDGADEDGFNFPNSLQIFQSGTFRLPIFITNTTGLNANLAVWIDWNQDGDFADAGEMVADLTDNGAGVFAQPSISIMVPSTAVTGLPLGFRARLSHEDNMTPNGRVSSGEVEDYLITVQDCASNNCLPISIIRK